MKRNGVKVLSVMLAAMLLTSGCQFLKEHEEATIGAGVGAVGGALLGGMVRGRKGALWGAALGALAGAAVGEYVVKKDKGPEATNQDYGYQPGQGIRLDLIGATVDPLTVGAGDTVDLEVTYALMAPDPGRAIEVKETRVIMFNGAKVVETEMIVDRTPGTYTARVPLTLPADAVAGTYDLKVTVATPEAVKQMTTRFVVQ